jgi:hypothetical protein
VEGSDVIVLSDYLPWALGIAVLLSALGGTVLGALALRQERARRRAPRGGGVRVIDGPVERAGEWIRLIELADGRRRLEVLGPRGWEPADRRPLARLLGV